MAKHRGVARDEFGNSLSGASVTVYDAGTTDEATIYSDIEMTAALDNPASTDDDGSYVFYTTPGIYDIQVAKSGFTTKTLEDEQIGQVMALVEIGLVNPITLAFDYTNTFNDTDSGASSVVGDYLAGFSFVAATGVLTYDGNAQIQALITLQGRGYAAATFTGNDIYIGFQKNGSGLVDSAQSYVAADGTDEARQFYTSKVVTLDKDDTLVALAFSTGSPFADFYFRDGRFTVESLG